MINKIQYGTSVIKYTLSRAARKTLAIEVHPDLSVKVVAPEKASLSAIEQKVLNRAKWIRKQQYYFEQFLPRPSTREYVSGETHHYLGRRYILRIRSGNSNLVKLQGGELIVRVSNLHHRGAIKEVITQWYHNRAESRFEESLDKMLPFFKTYNLKRPVLNLRKMSKRWGSCTPQGKIILNPEIIKAPGKCIDYVVIHELCHLVHLNHSQAFYDMQTKIMPDWEKWKLRLERNLC